MQTNPIIASTVAKQKQTEILQILGNLKNLSHLCSTNEFNVNQNAKRNLNNTEAAYGCKSRDFSTHVGFVGSDCLVFINSKLFIMPTKKSQSATPVAEIPTLQAIADKSQQVNQLREQLMQNLHSEAREQFRDLWGKARAELSRMQIIYHFANRKEACHA